MLKQEEKIQEEKRVIDYIKKKIILIEKEENRLIRLQEAHLLLIYFNEFMEVFEKNKKILISLHKKCHDIINEISIEKERHIRNLSHYLLLTSKL